MNLVANLTLTSALAVAGSATAKGDENPRIVKVAFVEALDPTDSVTSKKFREEYSGTIQLGKELTESALQKCGYQVKEKTYFFGISDPIEAKSGSVGSIGPTPISRCFYGLY